MKRWIQIGWVLMLVFGLTAAGMAAEVSQGRVLEVSMDPAVITIEEYDTNFSPEHPYGSPTGIVTRFDVQKAKIGLTPQPGDILRIAYRVQGEANLALKVMNVSKQDLRNK